MMNFKKYEWVVIKDGIPNSDPMRVMFDVKKDKHYPVVCEEYFTKRGFYFNEHLRYATKKEIIAHINKTLPISKTL